MSNMGQWLLLIPCLPLFAAALILFLGEAVLKRFSNLPCILAIVASAVLSIGVLTFVRRASAHEPALDELSESVAEWKQMPDKAARDKKQEELIHLAPTVMEKLQYEDLHAQATALEANPELRGGLEELVKRAKARHDVETKHPDRVLYTKFTWITATRGDDPPNDETVEHFGYDPTVSKSRVNFGLRADALSGIMLVMINSIAALIAIYSSGYMRGDPGFPRFFAAMSLFVFSMNMLVLGDNFLLLFVGWEGVGLCSYLLIGFWHEKPSAADAARKAFLVTRLGDVGLFLGILMLWMRYGSLSYDVVFTGIVNEVNSGKANETFLLAAALLLFCGAVGKSAQFPLHVWLPDAMEGPTPVSALIHAATMVTAGVYLVARCTPLYMAVPTAQLIIACIGGITMLLAALIALTQNDLKRVLAYSTLSQLGYMFLALGCALKSERISTIGEEARHPLATFAVTAAMFHLFTHAFFKALLFLSAGSVMHAMHHVIDMRRFSGLRKVLPLTHLAFLAGSLSLAAVPLTSGFFSKDEILAAAYDAGHDSHGSAKTLYYVLLGAGILTAFLTAFYTFRAYFKTFWGELKLPEEVTHGHGHSHSTAHGHSKSGSSHGGHSEAVLPASSVHGVKAKPSADSKGHGKAEESPALMTVPLMILAIPALAIGGLLGPWTHLFAKLLAKVPYFSLPGEEHHSENLMATLTSPHVVLMAVSSVVGLLGIALAWFMYVRRPALPGLLAARFPVLYQMSLNKFFFDEIYLFFIVRPAEGLAQFFRKADADGIDQSVDLLGQVPRLIGGLFRPVQNGLVQFYALAMILGLTVFLLALVRSL